MTTPQDRDIDVEVAVFVAAVGAVLRRGRERRGWTQGELGARLDGISTRMLAEIENGAAHATTFQVVQICSALDLEPAAVVAEAHGGSPGGSATCASDDLEVTVWIRTRDPDVSVELDRFEQQVVVTIGNNQHGEVLNMIFSDPSAIEGLGSRLLNVSGELADIFRTRGRA
jgi:transcriptional regulator with XRE-family HTH domain